MATLDIVTIEQARAAVFRSTSTDNDAVNDDDLARFVTGISERVDKLCGPVVQRTVTEIHEITTSGTWRVWPYETPIASVTSVKEWSGTGNTVTTLTEDGTFGTAPAANGFRVVSTNSYAHGQYIRRQSSGSLTSFADGQVQIVYTAGRYATTDAVEARWVHVVQSILRRMWDREQGAWARPVDPYGDPVLNVSRFHNAIDHVLKEQVAGELKIPAFA